MTAAEIAERLGLARSTVARWLRDAISRERPGELLHFDVKKLGRFSRAG